MCDESVNLLDRHLFKSVLGTCVVAVGLFACVLLVGNAMKELVGYALAGQIDALMLVHLLSLLLPFVVTFALPMGVLTGVLLTLGRLSADSEVTAMRSAGMSLMRIARPVIIFAVLGVALGLYFNHVAMPEARVAYKRDLTAAVRANPLSFIVPRTFIRHFPGFVVYVGDKQGTVLTDVWAWRLDGQQRVVQMTRAERGRIDYDEGGNTLILTLQHAQVEFRRDKTPEDFTEPPMVGSFEQAEALRLPLDKMFSRSVVRTKLDFLPWRELADEREKTLKIPAGETQEQRTARERLRARIDLVFSERCNNALAVLSFALIGVPLGIRVSRRETSANLGLAVALALGYYFMTTAIGWLEKRPDLNPGMLFFLPNVIYIVLALWLFRRVERR